jgi:hypothetical protein
VGGVEGLGVTFLEETFCCPTSNPKYRLHQQAARLVLKALLPETGTDIKGNMRSHTELLDASGCAERPEDFEALLRILNNEVRLITPTDPEGAQREGAKTAGLAAGERYYQLTHDYLVPSLRDWLTRKQKETRRGRAELRLAERAAAWNAKPENRHLPSWWEYLSIRGLTEAAKWSELERRMMRRADRLQTLRFAAAVCLLVCVVTAGVAGRNQYRRSVATGYVEQLLNTTAEGVAPFAELVRPLRSHGIPMLRAAFDDPDRSPSERLHAACALAMFGESDFSISIFPT